MSKKIIAANWKENPKSEKTALKLFNEVAAIKNENVSLVICPPFIFLEEIAHAQKVARVGSRVAVGAQDVFWEEKGAYTSEVSPRMLKSVGVKYVILGHSERRKWMNETDAMINKKIKLATKDGIDIILCVGEPLEVRKKGVVAAEKFVAAQLAKDLKGIDIKKIIIAYEPIWAIGTGESDSPADAATMARFIKKTLPASIGRKKVLYGGSVNSKNAADYVQLKEIDGALVGGASLKATEFKKLVAKIK